MLTVKSSKLLMTGNPFPIKGLCSSLFFLCLILSTLTYGQKPKADSLRELLIKERIDTIRIRLMWQLANDINTYNPDSAILISQQVLYKSKSIHYLEGESRALGVLANAFLKIGNYPRALDLNIEKLKLEEKRNNPRNLSSVLQNIGVAYVLQEQYRKALYYYYQSDSVVNKYNVEEMKYYIRLNMGDAYNRLNISDSAYMNFNRSLEIALQRNDGDLIGLSMTGLGHSYLKLGNYQLSESYYRNAINYLQSAGDDDILCEASLGLANLFKKVNKPDSAAHYANMSMSIANKDGFLSHQLEAAEFLADHYKKLKNIDSAYTYLNYVHTYNDSLNSKSRIRESQIISSNEQFRQREIEENRKLAKEERAQQLQLLFIGIFIPGLFLVTLLLSRIKIHVRFVRILGVLSLLFFFEYLTLFLHPRVAELTHHTPWIEILIFVGIGAILIPSHHKLEHWLISKLIHHRLKNEPQNLISENEVVAIPGNGETDAEDSGKDKGGNEAILPEPGSKDANESIDREKP
ncbi:MAG: tetratricopeptide repeat protein [Terrimonas sp.]|nr:tetratricopeptide repeat protein [Terrimonas sp.]